MLVRLMYVSTALQPTTEKVLNAIHAESALRNLKYDVTGFLHYNGLRFMQVIEGEADAIARLGGNIRRDKRHSDFTVILQEPIERRAFPLWSMQLLQPERADRPVTSLATARAPTLDDVAAMLDSEAARRALDMACRGGKDQGAH